MANSDGTRVIETISETASEKRDTPPADPLSTTLKPSRGIDCTAESEGMAFQIIGVDTPTPPLPKA